MYQRLEDLRRYWANWHKDDQSKFENSFRKADTFLDQESSAGHLTYTSIKNRAIALERCRKFAIGEGGRTTDALVALLTVDIVRRYAEHLVSRELATETVSAYLTNVDLGLEMLQPNPERHADLRQIINSTPGSRVASRPRRERLTPDASFAIGRAHVEHALRSGLKTTEDRVQHQAGAAVAMSARFAIRLEMFSRTIYVDTGQPEDNLKVPAIYRADDRLFLSCPHTGHSKELPPGGPIDPDLSDILETFIRTTRAMTIADPSDRDLWISSRTGRRIGSNGLYKQIVKASGMNPHAFRDALVTDRFDKSADNGQHAHLELGNSARVAAKHYDQSSFASAVEAINAAVKRLGG